MKHEETCSKIFNGQKREGAAKRTQQKAKKPQNQNRNNLNVTEKLLAVSCVFETIRRFLLLFAVRLGQVGHGQSAQCSLAIATVALT